MKSISIQYRSNRFEDNFHRKIATIQDFRLTYTLNGWEVNQ